MKSFYLSSAPAQMTLLVALFLTLILSLFLLLASYDKQRKSILRLSVFLFFLILLSVLADGF